MNPLERLRAICAELPDAIEVEAWQHPTFRVAGKTFVAYEIVGDRPSIAFRVDREQAEILGADRRFFATPYGRGLWVSVWADGRVPWKLVMNLARESYKRVAPKVRARSTVRH
jgi:predicted DNA-binding protein (MmcQ/YjbR family)